MEKLKSKRVDDFMGEEEEAEIAQKANQKFDKSKLKKEFDIEKIISDFVLK